MTRHPATVAHPFTDPTDWRDELDDIRRMLAEAGRSGPLRDEIAALLPDERERIAAMVEALPTMVWVGVSDPAPYRARTPVEIAAKIRGEV